MGQGSAPHLRMITSTAGLEGNVTTAKGRRLMPFSKDNPHRDRNLLLAAVLVIIAFGMVLAGWIYTDQSGRDTGAYEKFLTLLATVIAGALLNLWRQVRTERKVEQVQHHAEAQTSKLETVVEQTNGALDRRIEQALERRLSATGQTPLPGQSVNERYSGLTEPGEPPEPAPSPR